MNALLLFHRDFRHALSLPRVLFAYVLAPLLMLWLLCQLYGRLPGELRGFPAPSYLAFIVPALAVAGALPLSISAGAWVLEDRDAGLLEQVLATPVSHVALLIDELLAQSLSALVVVPVVLLAARAAGMMPGTSLVGGLALLPPALAVNGLYAAISLAVAALLPVRSHVLRIMGLLVFVSVILGDLLLPAMLLPNWLMTLSRLNPLAVAVHAARGALEPQPSWTTYGRDLLALAAANLVCGTVALALHVRQTALGLTPATA
jgi:ABC-2 type transport system permease protein